MSPARGSRALLVSALALSIGLPLACGASDDKNYVRPGAAGQGGEEPAGGGSNGIGNEGGAGAVAQGGGDAGGSVAEGGERSASGGAEPAGGAGGAGPEPEPDVIGAYVDCEAGDDEGEGTLESPLKTLALAVSVAPAGTSIVVLAGLCDETTQVPFNTTNGRVTLPDQVSLRAQVPGTVTFHGVDGYRSAGIELAGSGKISGIHFERFGIAISASSGTVELRDLTFNDVYQGSPLDLSGTAQVTLSPGAVTNYVGDNQRTFAELTGQAKLTVNGGSIEGALDSGISGAAMFSVTEQSELVLDGVTLDGNAHSGVRVVDSAKLLVQNGSVIRSTASVACCNQASVIVAGTATFELVDSVIEDSPSTGVQLLTGTPTVVARHASITGSAYTAIRAEVYSDSYPSITLEDVELSGNGSGIFSNYGATIDILDSVISDNNRGGCGAGLLLNATQVNSVKLRGTTISAHCSSGASIVGGAGSTFDLGRGNDPGLNVFVGNNPTNTAGQAQIAVNVPAGTMVYAAGNTWTPGVQGAAAAGSVTPPPGQYAVSPGLVMDVVGSVPTGGNFVILGAGANNTTLRVAESACVPTNTCP
jgi:hypothetical protein